jgi:hypothetical protein
VSIFNSSIRVSATLDVTAHVNASNEPNRTLSNSMASPARADVIGLLLRKLIQLACDSPGFAPWLVCLAVLSPQIDGPSPQRMRRRSTVPKILHIHILLLDRRIKKLIASMYRSNFIGCPQRHKLVASQTAKENSPSAIRNFMLAFLMQP